MNRVVFFSGLPKAGKSVTLHGLYKFLVETGQGSRFFLERVHPDQEGNWTAESSNGQEVARGHKNLLKDSNQFWSESFVRFACMSISGLANRFPVTLADMGGIPSQQNREILGAARSAGAAVEAVILYPAGTDPQEWVDFWTSEGITPTLLASQFVGLEYASEAFEAEKARLVRAAVCLLGLGSEDPAHGPAHIEAVRRGARELALEHAPGLVDVVDEAARLHDIGNHIDRETHEVIGAEVVATCPHMQKVWGQKLGLIVDAIREHRASTGNPQHLVGQIVSDADRLGTPEGSNPLRRSYEYHLSKEMVEDTDTAIRMAGEHIRKKYGPGGKGTRAYFDSTRQKIAAVRQPIIDAVEAGDISQLKKLAGIS